MKLKVQVTNNNLSVPRQVSKVYRVAPFGIPSGIPYSIFTTEGDLLVALGSSNPTRLPVGTNGQVLTVDTSVSGKLKYTSIELTLRNIENLLANGGFSVAQRGTSFTAAGNFPNNDDVYLIDQWILLSDGNDIVDVSQNALSAEQNPFYMRALVATANKKFGFLQVLEGKDSPEEGSSVSLSFRARTTGAAIRNVRAAVLSWDGTEDTVTSDVVSAWNTEGTNPTLVANWTYENTPSDLALTTDWQTFSIENIQVDTSGVKNVAVFIWVDDTDAAANDVLDIQWVKLERGNVASDFSPRQFTDDLSRCKRYFQKSYGSNIDPGSTSYPPAHVVAVTTALVRPLFHFDIEMFGSPTITEWSVGGTSNKLSSIASGYADAGAAITAINAGPKGIYYIAAGSLTANTIYGMHYIASAEL